MPSEFWEDQDEPFDWDEVERLHVHRGDDSWDIYAEVDGELVNIAEGLADDEMESLFWDDLYDWAMDNDVEVDREIEYAPE